MRYILIILVIVLIGLLLTGIFTNRLDSVFGVNFHNEQKADTTKLNTPKQENHSGDDIKINTMNGDILKDSSVKNVYNNFKDTLPKK